MPVIFLRDWKALGGRERRIVVAAFLGWTLDAFDFFLLVFVLKDVAHAFSVSLTTVTEAIFLTLASRPLGALFFGRLADRYGRRPVLMAVILLYPFFGFLSAIAPTIGVFLIFRGLFGVAMGGEWGAGSSLVMESIPAQCRGFVSGILQAGYPAGYLLASLAFVIFYPVSGWRGLLMLGILPAFLVFFIRRSVPESPSFSQRESRDSPNLWALGRKCWKLALYATVLMTAFNFLGHGTQDLYPTFLETTHHLSLEAVGGIAVFYNIGAILGGIVLGTISERIGRRRAILLAAMMVLVVLPFWGGADGLVSLGVGAFLMQFAVQGAWGVVPAYLNEIAPPEGRGAFPGVVYQTGNLLASANATLQSILANHLDGGLRIALILVAGLSALAIALLIVRGPERKGQPLLCE